MARTNLAARRFLTSSPAGPSGRLVTRKGIRVWNRSRQFCPVDRGRLRAAQRYTDPRPNPRGGVSVQIGSNVVYSLPIHEGSGSRFAPRSWRIAHARGHPVPARRFLTNALPAARG